MFTKLQKLIEKVYSISNDRNAPIAFDNALETIKDFLAKHHFLKEKEYLSEIRNISELLEDISGFRSNDDRLLQLRIQKAITNLSRQIIEENKKIFIVHERNISMRDKMSSLLGRLKLDYVVLEHEHNAGTTIKKGAGSSIFFHIWRENGARSSSGCTVMGEPSLRELIAWLEPRKNPVYVLLPQQVYAEKKKAWGLP